eukprot:14601916-Alexandrium_andersonii.AAC.1
MSCTPGFLPVRSHGFNMLSQVGLRNQLHLPAASVGLPLHWKARPRHQRVDASSKQQATSNKQQQQQQQQQ